MGRIITPKYRVEITACNDMHGHHTPSVWHCRDYGRPTAKNLEAWRQAENRSYLNNGVNQHISQHLGFVLHISKCRIVNQFTDETVCEVSAPMFECIATA